MRRASVNLPSGRRDSPVISLASAIVARIGSHLYVCSSSSSSSVLFSMDSMSRATNLGSSAVAWTLPADRLPSMRSTRRCRRAGAAASSPSFSSSSVTASSAAAAQAASPAPTPSSEALCAMARCSLASATATAISCISASVASSAPAVSSRSAAWNSQSTMKRSARSMTKWSCHVTQSDVSSGYFFTASVARSSPLVQALSHDLRVSLPKSL